MENKGRQYSKLMGIGGGSIILGGFHPVPKILSLLLLSYGVVEG